MFEQAPGAPESGTTPGVPCRLIAVIGLGAILPGARNVPEFWQNVRDGKDSVTEVPADRWDPLLFFDPDPAAKDKSYCKTGGFIREFTLDPREFRIPPRTLASMDRTQKFVLIATREAFRDSGYDRKTFDPTRVAVILGNASARSETETAATWRVQLPLLVEAAERHMIGAGYPREKVSRLLDEFRSRMLAGLPPLDEETLPGLLRNVALGRVASQFNLQGPTYVVDAACASGLAALDFAARGLLRHDFDLALSGGFSGSLDPMLFIGFSKFRGLSKDRVKPFDTGADGFVPGEGAGLLVLKRLEDAIEDGDRIYAVLRGIGSSSDGREKGIGAPNPVSQALAMERAFDQAGYPPSTVQLVETHGAGTTVGDLSEFRAMLETFGPRPGLRLTAVKSQIGHLVGAAGAVGALKTVLALYHKVFPPTINHREPNMELPWAESGYQVVTRPEPWPANRDGLPRRANVSSFGFGGNNFHAAFEEYSESYHASLVEKSRNVQRRASSSGQSDIGTRSTSLATGDKKPLREPIAVVGLGTALPQAYGIDEAWDAIVKGKNAIREAPPDRWEGKPRFFLSQNGEDAKTHTLLGGFIDHPAFDYRRFRIPPGTARGLDPMQRLFMQTALMALSDAGYADGRPFDRRRTAVLVGGSAGSQDSTWSGHFRSNALRARFHMSECEAAREMGLTGPALESLLDDMERTAVSAHPEVNEDTLLAGCIQIGAARFAKALDLMGTHAAVDAACASSLASVVEGVHGLRTGQWDMVIAGGVSEGLGPLFAVLASKAGVTSSHGSSPFDASADGFVPAEGSSVLVLKRLRDALADGDRVYAVIRGVGASSDGKGRAMMAPNAEGQARCLRKTYEDAGYGPETVGLVECHATSTALGDVVEVEALREVFGGVEGQVGLGSVKSQFGHLLGAAGATGLLKTILALHKKTLPPTINIRQPKDELRLQDSPFYLVESARPWEKPATGLPRRAGVSAFGFGGTNWHITVEEFDREYHERLVAENRDARQESSDTTPSAGDEPARTPEILPPPVMPSIPVTRIFAFSAPSREELERQLRDFQAAVCPPGLDPAGRELPTAPAVSHAGYNHPFRLAIVAATAKELHDKLALASGRVGEARPAPILEAQGIYIGRTSADDSKGKLCFLFPGQGPQYPDMWRQLFDSHPEVRETFHEADSTLVPLLGARLEDLVFTGAATADEVETRLLNSEIVQPVLLAANVAMYRLLRSRGLQPDILAGHSLGEYSALVGGGILDFASALRAVHVRGREFRRLSEGKQDPGLMAMITAPANEIEPVLSRVSGYVVIANRNCALQTVISGTSGPVREAVEILERQGVECRILPIAGAFHSAVARAIVPAMKEILGSLRYRTPELLVLSSVTGEYYGPDGISLQAVDNLVAQLSGPVDFIELVNRLYADGVRTYLEVGPKKALSSFVDDILSARPHRSLFSNHPKIGESNQLNRLLANLFAIGYPITLMGSIARSEATSVIGLPAKPTTPETVNPSEMSGRQVKQGMNKPAGQNGKETGHSAPAVRTSSGRGFAERIVITGASVGLPGRNHRVFSDQGIFRLLDGHSFIDSLSSEEQDLIVEKNVLRVVKSDNGDSYFERVEDREGSIKLAGRRGHFQLADFGLDQDWLQGADVTDQIAVAVGIEGLKDAAIPLQRSYRKTTTGSLIPTGWLLPEGLRDDTGVVFASVYAGLDKLIAEVSGYYKSTLGPLAAEGLRAVYHQKLEAARSTEERLAADQWFSAEIRRLRLQEPGAAYEYNRELLRIVNCKGNALLAQLIGARGPNLQVNSACASHAVALGVAEDMVRAGRARRVIVLAADDVTSNRLFEWMGTGFLAVGAAATDQDVCSAVLPFDRRRHGLVLGMGASAIVVETESSARERGIEPIAELLGVHSCNSAYHMTRLDPDHIADEMTKFLDRLGHLHGLKREELASKTLFMSHETYTPARGGSAQAEVEALKAAFGVGWKQVVVANTKGMTGHCQGAGIEDVVALKALQFERVPPVVNFEEEDPELVGVNLSQGGHRQLDFALGFAAGFGSQVSMFLVRAMARGSDRIGDTAHYRRWMAEVTGLADPRGVVHQRTLRVESGNGTEPAGEPAAARPQASPTQAAQPVPPPQVSVVPTAALSVAAADEPAKPAPAPAQAPPPAVRAGTMPRPTEADVREAVLALFEEKTGYERELLDLDLDLEADLGIDTIKQAQIFASIRDKYGLAREEGVRLKDFPTLRHVMDHIAGRTAAEPAGVAMDSSSPPAGAAPAREPDTEVAAMSTAPVANAPSFLKPVAAAETPVGEAPRAAPCEPARSSTPTEKEVLDAVLRLVEEKTGYERELLDLDLDLEADLGIDTIKQAQILGSIREQYQLPREEGIRLKDFPTLRHVVGYISNRVASSVEGPPNRALPPETQPQEAQLPSVDNPVPTPVTQPAQPAADLSEPVRPANQPDRPDEVQETVLALVEEKTGYERQFLDLDLDLEADLGIDTIKQAQIFVLVRERFNLPREEGVRLKEFPTLRHVIGYINGRLAASQSSAPGSQERPSGEGPLQSNPVEVGSPDLEAESAEAAEPPVEWSEIRRWTIACQPAPAKPNQDLQFQGGGAVLVTDDGAGVAQALLQKLPEFGLVAVLLTDSGRPAGSAGRVVNFEDAVQLEETVREIARSSGPIRGLIHALPLRALNPTGRMSLAEWRTTTARETKSLRALAKALLDQPRDDSKNRGFFAALTSLGGRFGFAEAGSRTAAMANPSQGGVAGFVKAFSKETSAWMAKVIDLDRQESVAQPDAIAGAILTEILSGDLAVEVGFRHGVRAVPILAHQPVDLSARPGIHLDNSSVLLLFGGARGITGAIAKGLADSFRCHMVLVGTTALPPGRGIAELSGEALGRLRKQVFEELRQRDPRATPAQAEAAVQKQLRAAEIQRTLEGVRGAGSRVDYEVCDVRDPEAMSALLGQLSRRFGRLDGVVYGAGIIEDKLLEDKREESFNRVFDVKADGFFNLCQSLTAHPELKPAFVASFSSVAARFGNRGQTDYAAANELLSKLTGDLGRRLTGTRCFAIDWTAWAEVGLPARSGLAELMQQQGMDLIHPREGAQVFRDELLYGSGQEVLYAGRVPGYDDGAARVSAAPARQADFPPGLAPMLGEVVEYHRGAWLRAERTIHPQRDAWLADHVIDGVPLVPGVLGVEMMVEAARLLFPELHFVGLDDLRILLSVKVLKDRPVTLKISAQAHSALRPENRLVLVRMESEFIDPQGRRLGDTRRHYQTTVVLSSRKPAPKTAPLSLPDCSGASCLANGEIYGQDKLLPHGPAFQVLREMRTVEDGSAIGWVAPVSEQVLCPALNGYQLSTLPLAREAGFQVAGLWGILKPGIMSLPNGCRRLRHYGSPPENTRLIARTTNFRVSEQSIECDLEIVGEDGTVYDRMEGYYAVPVGQVQKL